jgi:hypothetical protein
MYFNGQYNTAVHILTRTVYKTVLLGWQKCLHLSTWAENKSFLYCCMWRCKELRDKNRGWQVILFTTGKAFLNWKGIRTVAQTASRRFLPKAVRVRA